MKKYLRAFSLTFFFLYLPVTFLFAQTGSVTGTVMDDNNQPLPGATVQVEGTSFGSVTDDNGYFTLSDIPPGDHFLIARYLGYAPARKQIQIEPNLEQEVHFSLIRDPLGIDELIVSGTFNPATQLESSTAITTISPEQIERRIPRGSADLLKAVPGIQVTSNYGETGADVTVRGLPLTANSSFRYISLQEDGLPVFEPPGLLFAFPDAMARHDETIARVEAVRGGSSAVFASNTPGGIVNFISKTGGDQLSGTVKNSVGIHGMMRQDVNVGGPLNENWKFNTGGYYRHDEGVRHPGFPANRGGQFKLNLTRNFNAGYLRFYGKYLNEKNIWFMGSPIQNYKTPEAIPGGPEIASGTTFSSERRVFSIPDAYNHGAFTKKNMDNVYDVTYKMIGFELYNSLGNGWDLSLRSRMLASENNMNLMIDVADPFPITSFGQPGLPAEVPRFIRAVNSGETITDQQEIASLNGNGLMTVHGLAFSEQPVYNFISNIQATKQAGKHSLNAGLYYSTYRTQLRLVQQGIFLEVANHPGMIQVMIPDSDGTPAGLTPADGFAGYNSGYWNLRSYTNLAAFYLGDNWQVTDKLNIDGGLRFDINFSNGDAERPVIPGEVNDGEVAGQSVPESYPSFVPSPQQSRAGMFGSGRFRTWDYTFSNISGSLGANYRLSDSFALYGRFSRGNRSPTVQQWTFQTSDGSQVTGDTNKGETETITQGEAGLKVRAGRWSMLLTGFYSASKNLITTLHRGQADGSFIFLPITGDTRTTGAEIEIAVQPVPGLELRTNSTIQDPRFTKFEYEFFVPGDNPDSGLHKRDYSGNYLNDAVRIMADITASYIYGPADFFINYRYTGERMANRPNTITIPAYDEVMAGFSLGFNRFDIGVRATNLFNTQAIAQMANRTGEDVLRVNDNGTAEIMVTTGAQAGTRSETFYTTGLGILPRSILISAAYHF